MVLEQQFSWNCFKNNSIFLYLSPAASHFHPLQVENCDSNSRLVVDEDDYGKFRLKRVNAVPTTGFTYTIFVFIEMIPRMIPLAINATHARVVTIAVNSSLF